MRLLVIGGVAAGLSAASRARRLDKSAEIVVLEKSAHIAYGACGLPYFIQGQVRKLEELQVYSASHFENERNIRIRTGIEVVTIAHARREVLLRSGERVHYDKLILATGARRDTTAIAGSDAPHVLRMDTWVDAERVQSFLAERKPQRAVVVGAGYIGLEVVEALRSRGLQVEVHEQSPNLLGRDDPWLTQLLVKHLERCRVTLRLNAPVRQVPECDLAVVACGLKPNVLLAADAGVEIGRTGAIRVTDRMETNLTGVYAAGDCAEAMHLVSGRPTWFPLGTTANKMGRVAGASALGARDRFAGIVGTSIARVCGLGVGMTGLSPAQGKAAGFDAVSATVEALEKPRYFRGRKCHVQLVADRRTGRLLGGTILGEHDVAGRVNVLAAALHQRMTVEELSGLDLAYAPPFSTVWDPLLIAAQQLVKLLH